MLRFHPMADGLASFAENVVPLLRERLVIEAGVVQPEPVHG